ncbi:diacylglycerol kinase family protein, partial [Salmonella sp. s51933]
MSRSPGSFLILNGKSADNEILRGSVKLLRDQGHPIEVRVTWEKGDAARYVSEAADQGAQTVIAAGGDGTINEVAAALAGVTQEKRPALGLLPLGTANDFATSAAVPDDIELALKLAIEGR